MKTGNKTPGPKPLKEAFIRLKPGTVVRRDRIASLQELTTPFPDHRGGDEITHVVRLEPATISDDAKFNNVWVSRTQAEAIERELIP